MDGWLTRMEGYCLVIRPTSGWQALNLRELWQFRDLLITLAIRDVKLRYRQTALGALWVVLQPLIAAGIFAFVFGRVARMPSDGVPYFLFAYAGLLGWNAFNSTLTKASNCMVQNAQLVSKVYFPRLILPLSTVASTLIDFSVALAMLAVLMGLYGIMPGMGLFLLPICLLLLLLLSLGLGLFAAALMVRYRDVQYVLPVMAQFVMYASPVAYAVSAVPDRLRSLYLINPLSGLLEGCRWALLGRGALHPGYFVYSALTAILVFAWGALAFKKMERQFADVI
ncbi:MAG TPA: ABC transporter permease [Chthonomonadaceae bacterium]|nr:ABC transporter permease [Chthonomonadaceae bacterium]